MTDFVKESFDYLISLLEPVVWTFCLCLFLTVTDQRDELFNTMAAKYNIKVLHSTKKMPRPMQLEMVRENLKENFFRKFQRDSKQS